MRPRDTEKRTWEFTCKLLEIGHEETARAFLVSPAEAEESLLDALRKDVLSAWIERERYAPALFSKAIIRQQEFRPSFVRLGFVYEHQIAVRCPEPPGIRLQTRTTYISPDFSARQVLEVFPPNDTRAGAKALKMAPPKAKTERRNAVTAERKRRPDHGKSDERLIQSLRKIGAAKRRLKSELPSSYMGQAKLILLNTPDLHMEQETLRKILAGQYPPAKALVTQSRAVPVWDTK
jgi:hypothetical protein